MRLQILGLCVLLSLVTGKLVTEEEETHQVVEEHVEHIDKPGVFVNNAVAEEAMEDAGGDINDPTWRWLGQHEDVVVPVVKTKHEKVAIVPPVGHGGRAIHGHSIKVYTDGRKEAGPVTEGDEEEEEHHHGEEDEDEDEEEEEEEEHHHVHHHVHLKSGSRKHGGEEEEDEDEEHHHGDEDEDEEEEEEEERHRELSKEDREALLRGEPVGMHGHPLAESERTKNREFHKKLGHKLKFPDGGKGMPARKRVEVKGADKSEENSASGSSASAAAESSAAPKAETPAAPETFPEPGAPTGGDAGGKAPDAAPAPTGDAPQPTADAAAPAPQPTGDAQAADVGGQPPGGLPGSLSDKPTSAPGTGKIESPGTMNKEQSFIATRSRKLRSRV